jgi:hypothetical protein
MRVNVIKTKFDMYQHHFLMLPIACHSTHFIYFMVNKTSLLPPDRLLHPGRDWKALSLVAPTEYTQSGNGHFLAYISSC